MTNVDRVVSQYLAIWNETNDEKRLAAVKNLYAEDATYCDPLADVAGWDGVAGFIGAVQKQYPGVTFVLGGKIDAHHDVARFSWHALAPGGTEPVAIGFDVAVLEADRIRRVHGFLDKAPG